MTGIRSNRIIGLPTVVCMLVFALACYQSASLLSQARSARLVAAEYAIAQATVPLIRQDRVSPALIRAAGSVLANARLDLNYVTLRNTANETLVSHGRFESTFGWLSAASARQWRGLLYRMLSAEAAQALMRDGQTVGFAQIGASWLGILAVAGVTAWLWITLLLVTAIVTCGLIIRLKNMPARPIEQRHASPLAPPGSGRRPVVPAPRLPVKASSLFKARRSRPGADEYAPISPAASVSAAAEARDTSFPRSRAAPVPEQLQPELEPAPEPPRSPEPPAAQPVTRETPAVPEPPLAAAPQPAVTTPEAAPQNGPEFQAPQLGAEPTLGDDTLDLCFFPIWRGADRRALAGASATLAWRSGEGELVDPATLTRLAERDGALRAFTHWIARRFSVLHSNWRNLELDTVPIVLPIPTAMLAFADAEVVWQDAIARTDRDPDDLILKLTRQSVVRNPSQLPIRHALAMDETDGVRAGGDVLCIKPADVTGAPERWGASLDEPGPPILFGPVDEPEQWRDTLDHDRVVWFSEERSGLCSTREFARLLARRECRAL